MTTKTTARLAWILVVGMIISVGCGGPQDVSKQQVKAQWDQSRATMLYSVASEHLRVGQLDQAFIKTREALALAPEFHPASILLGKVLIEQGNYADAITVLATVCEKLPQAAEPVYLLGVAQEKMRQYDSALVSYRKAYMLDNSRLDAVNAAAEVLMLTDRVEAAKSLIDDTIARAGNEPAMYETAGRIAMMRQDYVAAERYFQDAHDLDFNNVRYRELLGEAQFLSGDYAEAVQTFTHLLAIKDYRAGATTYAMLGDSFMAVGRHVDARNAYLKSTEVNPNSSGAWVNLAQASLALGDDERAMRSARSALSIDANNVDATLVLGYAMLRNGKLTDATEILSKAVARHGDHVQLQLVLGRCHQLAGKTELAQACYNKALAIEPDNLLARELLRTTSESETQRIVIIHN
ncbi:MAG: tetratricopeptide repeat protein [Phycisphaerae bacterium]|nr:tetratricopeptide repeat protein [Phycisphaerae bacterium]